MNFNINVYFHPEPKPDTLVLDTLKQQGTMTMTILQNLIAQVAANSTVSASAVTLLDGLKAKLDACLAADGVDQAALQALSDTLGAETAALAAAVQANTTVESAAADPAAVETAPAEPAPADTVVA